MKNPRTTPRTELRAVVVCVSDVIDFVELAPQTTQHGLLGSDDLKINRAARWGGLGRWGKLLTLIDTFTRARIKVLYVTKKKPNFPC